MKVPDISANVSPKIEHIKCCLCIRRGKKKEHSDSDSDLSNDKHKEHKHKKKYVQNNIFMVIKQKSKDFKASKQRCQTQ